MLRIVARFSGIKKKIAYTSKNRFSTLVKKSQHFERHLEQNKRYEVFSPSATNIFEYDEESKRLVKWEKSPSSPIIDWQHLPADDSRTECYVDAFRTMLSYSKAEQIPLTNECFDQFIDRFIVQMSRFSANQLLRAVQMFAQAKPTRELMVQRNYVELHRAFDRQSTIQLANLHINQCLFLCSIWLEITFHRKTHFAVCVSRLFNRRFPSMTVSELALAAYYLTRLSRPVDEIRELENHFDKAIDEMTIVDIAMMAWAFERNEAKIENMKLRDKLFTHLAKFEASQFDANMMHKLCPVRSIYLCK